MGVSPHREMDVTTEVRCASQQKSAAMSELGHLQQVRRASKTIDVRFAPKATVSN
jgi:hypothetical protein